MPPTFGWDNFEDIAIGLADKYPDTDPSPSASPTCTNGSLNSPASPATLPLPTKPNSKPSQMAWHEEFLDRQG